MTQNSTLHSVAWHAPEYFLQVNEIQTSLSSHNLIVNLNSSITGDEDITLLHVDMYSELNELEEFYKSYYSPTLIIVKNNDQESEVFKFLKPGDDICRTDSHMSVIAGKISRILNGHQIRSLQSEKLDLFNDPLTGLLSRAAMHKELAYYADSEIPLSSESWAIIFIDIDNFKPINDCFGHEQGDEVLREIAMLLLRETKPEDRVSRFGGDEFVLLISRYNKQTILDSIDRIRQNITAHKFRFAQKENENQVTASFGIKFLIPPLKIDESLQQADMAMYQAKNNGRNKVVCYDSMVDSGSNFEQDLHLQHFENVTRVVNERVTNLITLMGRRMIEAARQEANNDALTQLHNRRYFDNRLSREFEIAKKYRRNLTIALMDIDYFHNVNVTYGWPTGDHVLRIFSKIASENIRLVDWLARYGGEEFCVVMLDTELDQGIAIAERIREAVAASNVQSLDNRPVDLTVSIGVAILTSEIGSPVDLVQMASKSLIFAKESGRNRVCYNQ